jgi:hypothetical protein
LKKIVIAIALLAITACTDTTAARWQALGAPGHVMCFSGGQKIFDDHSTGKIHNAEASDGYQFKSRTTGRLIEVSGDCIVDYNS